jgi:hypothetical protein
MGNRIITVVALVLLAGLAALAGAVARVCGPLDLFHAEAFRNDLVFGGCIYNVTAASQ